MRLWMSGFGLVALASWSVDAFGQEGPQTDLHGLTPPAVGRSGGAPLSVLVAPRWARGAYRFGVLGEFADQPASLFTSDGFGEVTRQPLIESVVGANLGGGYAISRRIGVEATLPLLFVQLPGTSSLTVGDLQLTVPMGLVVPSEAGGDGVAVGVAPWISVPTGKRRASVGGGGGGGGQLLAGWRSQRVSVDAAGGVAWTRPTVFFEQSFGGLQLPFAAGVSVRPAGKTWLGAELRGQADPGLQVPESRIGPTMEALLTLRTTGGPAWFGTGVGSGVSSGPGSARFRALVGVAVGDDRLGRTDSALPPVDIVVTDANDQPIAGAEILADGVVVGVTGADGAVELTQEVLWPAVVSVRADDHMGVEVAKPDVVALPVRVMLMTDSAVVPSRVTDQQGQPMEGAWVARALDGQEVVRGPMGEMELPPGVWAVTFEAPGLAPQIRVLEVLPGRAVEPLEVVLAPAAGDRELVLQIVDVEGRAVVGARVLIDGAPVGLSSAGGPLTLFGMAPVETAIIVKRQGYNPVELIIPGAGKVEPIVMVRTPGSVKIIVVDAGGVAVSDATVRFLGPARLPTATVGPTGERTQVLGAGKWTVLVSSPSYGAQARDIEIAPDAYGMEVVDVVLRPDEGGLVDLRVSVVDQDARPVEGVAVSLADLPVGSTGSGGGVRLTGLAPGVRDLTVIGDLLRGVKPIPLELFDGAQEVVVPVRWVPGAVEVRVLGPDGPAVDARIRLAGSDVRSFDVDEDGMLRTSVPAGDWSVIVSSPTYGVQQRAIHIAKDSEILHRVEVLLRPPEGGLADLSVRVVNPEGQPVPSATVSLDGYSVGRTGPDGGLVMEGLAIGPRDLQVDSALYTPVDRPIRLMEGQQEVEETLEWVAGAVRVLAVSDRKPVLDALVRLLGPSAVPSGPVNENGARTVPLSAGRWQALVSSPTLGVAQQGFVVPSGATDRIDVEVVMRTMDADAVELVLRVVDPAGVPVPNVAVRVGGEKIGITGDGGVLLANDGLVVGSLGLFLEHPTHQTVSMTIQLAQGSSERVVEMDWIEQSVDIVVVDEEGRPAAGEVVWRGTGDVPATALDASGRGSASLRPGSWEAFISGTSGVGRHAFLVEDKPLQIDAVVGASTVDATATSIAILGSVLFEVNASTLRPGSASLLNDVATELLRGNDVTVEVQGHTDSTGTPAQNQALSEARAESVLEALIALGVPREVLTARGYGPQRPIGDNRTDEGRQVNRRVQFDVLESAPE